MRHIDLLVKLSSYGITWSVYSVIIYFLMEIPSLKLFVNVQSNWDASNQRRRLPVITSRTNPFSTLDEFWISLLIIRYIVATPKHMMNKHYQLISHQNQTPNYHQSRRINFPSGRNLKLKDYWTLSSIQTSSETSTLHTIHC